LPQWQKSILIIDIWSVHQSKEFTGWMKGNHPDIKINYIPGGCMCSFLSFETLTLVIFPNRHREVSTCQCRPIMTYQAPYMMPMPRGPDFICQGRAQQRGGTW
ncbi:hypothetical protein BS47DRAFT_1299256, partial [Hydnum rufescens UP504]